jgi:DNA-binding IclR family transcriptional regulator
MNDTVKSARRVLEVLEYFAERQRPATVQEIRQALDYPQSSTSVLLHSLTTLGYLSQEPGTRRFQPTIRIALLGSWLIEHAGRGRNPPAMMRRLSAATGDMILLGTQQGMNAVYVKIEQATNPIRFHMKQGACRPLCTTAIGRALLSSKSDTEIGAIVRRANAEREAGDPLISPAEVLDAVRHGRKLGYFLTKGIVTPGAAVIAMRLDGLGDHPPLAVGIGAPVDRIESELSNFVELLRIEVRQAAPRKAPSTSHPQHANS